MNRLKNLGRLWLTVAAATALAACGGGGGGSGPDASLQGGGNPPAVVSTTRIAGTVAVGNGIELADVSLRDLDGYVDSAITDGRGGFLFRDLKDLKPPYVLKAQFKVRGVQFSLLSISLGEAGRDLTVNITPLSDMISRAYAPAKTPQQIWEEGIGEDRSRLSKVVAGLKSTFGSLWPSGLNDPIGEALVPDPSVSAHDALLERVRLDYANDAARVRNVRNEIIATAPLSAIGDGTVGGDAQTVTASESAAAMEAAGTLEAPVSALRNETRATEDGTHVAIPDEELKRAVFAAGLITEPRITIDQLKAIREGIRSRVGGISDLTGLRYAAAVGYIDLQSNAITDLGELLLIPEVARIPFIDLRGNPLSAKAYAEQIPELERRGATLYYDAPVALGPFEITPRSGEAPLTVTLTAVDPHRQLVSVVWTASDGQTATGSPASLTFAQTGRVTVAMSALDAAGQTYGSEQTVDVSSPPSPVDATCTSEETFTVRDGNRRYVTCADAAGYRQGVSTVFALDFPAPVLVRKETVDHGCMVSFENYYAGTDPRIAPGALLYRWDATSSSCVPGVTPAGQPYDICARYVEYDPITGASYPGEYCATDTPRMRGG